MKPRQAFEIFQTLSYNDIPELTFSLSSSQWSREESEAAYLAQGYTEALWWSQLTLKA